MASPPEDERRRVHPENERWSLHPRTIDGESTSRMNDGPSPGMHDGESTSRMNDGESTRG
jgi:hypothetical protein